MNLDWRTVLDAIMVPDGTGIHPHLAAVPCASSEAEPCDLLIYSIVEIAADPRTAGIVSAILCYAWILLPRATFLTMRRPPTSRTLYGPSDLT